MFTAASSAVASGLIDVLGAGGDVCTIMGGAVGAYLQIPETEDVVIPIPEEMKPRLIARGTNPEGKVYKVAKNCTAAVMPAYALVTF